MFIIALSSIGFAAVDVVEDFDFSRCGYEQNVHGIPFVPAVYEVEPVSGDATALIQQAIDAVSARPIDASGFRGAVLLGKGTFEVSGTLVISANGVVLRGSGEEETILQATGNSRRTLIEMKGQGDVVLKNQHTISSAFVEPGAVSFSLDDTEGLSIGDSVFIERPSTEEWIDALGMKDFKGLFLEKRLNWVEGTRNVIWDRTITNLVGDVVYLDIPLTTEIDSSLGQATVRAYTWETRIENVGVEHLRCISDFDSNNAKDEEHAWFCVHLKHVKNGWVRNLTAIHFVSSAVRLDPSVSQVTVEFCQSLSPVSEIGGRRRVSFYNGGQLNLVRNCYAENGRHDFVVGFCSAGPNVFKDCIGDNALSFSGSFESWACGALFDNVGINGNSIRFSNLETYGDGMGWSGSQCILWNCDGAELDADNPPGSQNHIYSGRGSLVGDVEPVYPFRHHPVHSLFDEHLAARTDLEKDSKSEPKRYAFGTENPPVFGFDPSQVKTPLPSPTKPIEIINGRFVCDGKIFWSGHWGSEIWVGGMTKAQARQASPNLTRYVPGREGPGYTDHLEKLSELLLTKDLRMFGYRPNLWYDRRRMDHQWVARQNGDVVAPFLEMPWARTGEGTAWDGLSKFDLTKFNPWYFNRVNEFAKLCDQKGLLLYHEVYNNHWLIENGSHWVDCPWRPVNALQDTGTTEPPPFIYGPRDNDHFFIELVDEFYDLTHAVNRELHRRYIVQCFDNLRERKNVLHTIGFQYFGNLEFVQFFFDTVQDWQNRNGITLKLAIQTAKNITDALLVDPQYADMISVIDMRYWQDMQNGILFAPDGGKNRAFRQYRRYTFPDTDGNKVPPSTEELLYKQVREYRDVYPDKAVMAYHAEVGPLPILMAGGAYVVYSNDGLGLSKPGRGEKSLYAFINEDLGKDLWKMFPDDTVLSDPSQNWCLADPSETYLIYSTSGEAIEAAIEMGDYGYTWLTPSAEPLTSGQILVTDGGSISISPPENQPALLLIKKAQ